jgi:hypothetical protein
MASAARLTTTLHVSAWWPSAVMRKPGLVVTLRKFNPKVAPMYNILIANSNTRTDCAPGLCYEGACVGDKVYSTDGTCGHNHGNRQCTGKWGDCCNLDGQCGTGDSFCGIGKCHSGNCIRYPPLPWLAGNTSDGTCGGPYNYVCNVVFGNCCNKDGVCGSLPSDCGVGW